MPGHAPTRTSPPRTFSVETMAGPVKRHCAATRSRRRSSPPRRIPKSWLQIQTNLVSLELIRHGGDPERLESVVAHCRDALRLTAEPMTLVDLSRTMADALALLGLWHEALEIYDSLERAGERRRDAVATGTGRRVLATRFAGLHSAAATCLLRTGNPGKAIVRLERGRTRALAEHRALGTVALAGLPRASAARVAEAQHQLMLLSQRSAARRRASNAGLTRYWARCCAVPERIWAPPSTRLARPRVPTSCH